MGKRFLKQTVFITGGSSGIGAALGRIFAQEGARVALMARRGAALESVVESIRSETGVEALALVGDVRDRTSLHSTIEQTVDAFGGIDVAIANAGFGVSGSFESLTTEDFRRQFETNFLESWTRSTACSRT
jgi:NAD(P)-dependent dehydrogenase (short-subunit alcohol dehydrogenase family)